MAELSQNDLKAIKSHPLAREGLQNFRKSFRSKYLNNGSGDATGVVDQLTYKTVDAGEEDYFTRLQNLLIDYRSARCDTRSYFSTF